MHTKRCLFYFDYNHNSLFPLQSEGCGWGAVALEPLEKGDFIVEYVGEGTNFSAMLNISNRNNKQLVDDCTYAMVEWHSVCALISTGFN